MSLFSGSLALMMNERVGQVFWLGRYNPVFVKFLLKKPPMSYIKDIFTLAFDMYVWISIGITLIIVAVVSFIVLNVEAKREKV